MGKYDVNFKRLALLLTPTFWRRPIFGALLYAVISPLAAIHRAFMAFREETRFRLAYNGQVCRLRAVLNDRFDPVRRRITVTNPTGEWGGLMIYRRLELKHHFLRRRAEGHATKLRRVGMFGLDEADFWVCVPTELLGVLDEGRLRATVNLYKLASRRFTIKYI